MAAGWITMDAEVAMASRRVSIPVDAQTGEAWDSIADEERRKIESVLGLWLRDLASREPESLRRVMEDAGREAKARGLTPEILESLLRDI